MVGKNGRLSILENAEALFREHGYKPVSLADIARAVGIRKPSIYHHFPEGKEQLFVEVQLRVFARVREWISEAIDRSPEQLRDRLSAAVQELARRKPLYVLSMVHHDMPELSSENRRALSTASYEAVMLPIVAVIKDAQDRGEARRLDAHAVAGSVIAIVEGNTIAHAAGYAREPLARMMDQSIDLLLHGLEIKQDTIVQ